MVEEHEAVDGPLGLSDVVCDEQNGRPALGNPANLVPQQAPSHRIDVVGRLVEDDESPRLGHRHGEGGQAGDAAGDLLRKLVRPLPHVENIDQFAGPGAHRPASAPSNPSRQLNRFARADAGDRHVRLRLDAYEPPGKLRLGHDVDAADGDRARVRSIQPDDLIDERRLAGAVVAEDSDHLAGFHVHRDSVVRPNQARAGAKALVQVLDGENLVHRVPLPFASCLAKQIPFGICQTDYHGIAPTQARRHGGKLRAPARTQTKLRSFAVLTAKRTRARFDSGRYALVDEIGCRLQAEARHNPVKSRFSPQGLLRK